MNRMNCGLIPVLHTQPQAAAVVRGSEDYPEISGLVRFYQTACGTVVYADINGLPTSRGRCSENFFGFHIHGGTSCTGTKDDPFADALSHYNPRGCRHPAHAGDMPPLLGCRGKAVSAFITDRFTVREILEKTVIIHDEPDDFKSQPGGDAGDRIACGVIRSVTRR